MDDQMDEKDINHPYLEHPRKQRFYRILANIMTFIAVGERHWWGYKRPTYKKIFFLNRLAVYVGTPGLFVSQLLYYYFYHNQISFNTRGIMFAIVPANALVNVGVITAKLPSFRKVMMDFMDKIHIHNLKQTPYVKKQIVKTEKHARYACFFMAFFLMMDWLSWCSVTSYNNYKNYDAIMNYTMQFETVIYHMFPFKYENDLRNWCMVHSMNCYFLWTACVIIIINISINIMFIFQLIGHIEVFKHRLATEFIEDSSQEEYREKLADVIKYHCFILNIFEDIQTAFGFNVTAFYMYNFIADSLVLYQIMMGDKGSISMYIFLILALMGGLIVMSFVLEEIRRQSDDISDLVYNLPWENMSQSNKKMVLLFLMKVQQTMVFEGAFGLRAGVNPMISILKSTFSYYVMLKEM